MWQASQQEQAVKKTEIQTVEKEEEVKNCNLMMMMMMMTQPKSEILLNIVYQYVYVLIKFAIFTWYDFNKLFSHTERKINRKIEKKRFDIINRDIQGTYWHHLLIMTYIINNNKWFESDPYTPVYNIKYFYFFSNLPVY